MRGLLLALSLLLATPCWAQIDDKVIVAGKGMEMVVPVIAQLVVAAELCGFGETQSWKRIIEAIDNRYRHCLAQDPGWSGLAVGWEKQEREAKARGSSTIIGSLAFEDFLGTRGAEARATGSASYCTGPWRMVLEPGSATEQAKAEFLRSKPSVTAERLEEFLSWTSWIHTLGDDQGWVKTPCDAFWPTSSNTKK